MGYKTNQILVCCDDGHGLETAGKRTPKYSDGSIIHENEFNHPTKVLLIEALKRQGFKTCDVSPARTDNSLSDRCTRANKAMKAGNYTTSTCCYISIHFNAMNSYWQDNVGGIETYSYYTSTKGAKLSKAVHEQLLKGTNLKDRKTKTAGFYVLKYTAMPSILCECGFMDNKVEAQLMLNLNYQNECAEEICKGVCNYYGITYIEPISNDLEALVKKISPNYYDIWLKHFKAYPDLNWLGFIESAMKL